MALEVHVRRARLNDAEAIANFVNSARPGNPVVRLDVADRFSQVGFMIAEHEGRMVGLLGWQVENLVIRVTDFLIAPAIDRVVAGRALIQSMEEEGKLLQAEASILFLPPTPSRDLISYWEMFGYEHRPVSDMYKAWREAAAEWNATSSGVMIKQLRKDLTRRPI